MLAALPTSTHAIPMTDSPLTSPTQFQDASSVENKTCPGCQDSVMNDTGGVVIAFGQSFFHVDCFKCAKCGNKVTADTNLLLLSDGQPVCSNCSYSCSVCHLPILDEAIMTGDDSYHAHCFKCRACHNRIDELMFAKTSHGIYCMSCHHQRVARSRRHAQKQKDRDKSVGGSSSSRTRERLAKEQNGTGSLNKTPSTAQTTSTATSATLTPPVTGSNTGPYRSSTLPDSAQYTSSPVPPSRRQSIQSIQDNRHGWTQQSESGRSTSSRRPSVTVDPPSDVRRAAQPSSSRPTTPAAVDEFGQKIRAQDQYVLSPTTMLNSMTALLAPSDDEHHMHRRPSYDNDVRPLDLVPKKNAPANGEAVQGLTVPNKGLNSMKKRQSINPGAPLDMSSLSGSTGSPDSFASQSMNGRGSPHNAYSPVREQSGMGLSRKTSHASLRAPPMAVSKSEASSSQSKRLQPIEPSFDRPGSAGSTRSEYPQSQQELVRPPMQHSITLDRVPPRSHSLVANVPQETSRSLDRGPSPLGLPTSIRPARSFDDRSARPNISHGRAASNSLTIDVEKSRRGLGTRSPQASPAHKVDVPSGIESGTDTEAEGENPRREADSSDDSAPAPPPKDQKVKPRPEQLQLSEYMSPDLSDVPHTDSAAVSDAEESSPVQRVSRSTFIAPALPPIRFSMNTGDFSDLLQSVNGRNSLKGLDQLGGTKQPPKTPPPTAASDQDAWQKSTPTPTSVTTFGMSFDSMDQSDATSMTSMATVSASVDHGDKRSYADERRSSTPSRSSFSPIDRAPSQNSSLPDTVSRSNSFGSSNAHSDARNVAEFPSSQDRSHSELPYQSRVSPPSIAQRERFDSTTSFNPDGSVSYESSARITVTTPGSSVARPLRYDASELVTRRLQEALHEASKRGAMHVNLDKEFVQAILMVVEQRKVENAEMKGKLDGMKRASQQYMDGLTVAQGEYDKELNARRDAEAEVTRLRVLLSGQAARITAMSGDSRKDELQKQLSRELSDNLSGLERDVSVLRVERDVALAEVEELVTSKSSSSIADSEKTGMSVSRSLTTRLDKLKNHYKRELVPLTEEREALLREIAELKGARDVFLEETTMLNARNEELAQLNALYARRIESAAPSQQPADGAADEKRSMSIDKPQPPQPAMQPSNTVMTTASLATDESTESKFVKVQKPNPDESPATLRGKFRWRAMKEVAGAPNLSQDSNEKGGMKHQFQQLSVLRFTRCDHCGDKLWGSLCRCAACNISVHPRCVPNTQSACTPQAPTRKEDQNQQMALLPSMFGRDLVEQVRTDARGSDRMVPVLVEKCIQAVEASAMEYEGIYRKTGGSSQSKLITQLFERGDYTSFDLLDSERFNDICSITSVLKTYFRSLPNPLLTFALHDEFMHASAIRDTAYRDAKYADLVKQLPTEHYYTLRVLMLHLHRIHELNSINLMTARNLGVVFGPTLMRSRDPSAEFSDMAGKALTVEWLVENAPDVFPPLPNSS